MRFAQNMTELVGNTPMVKLGNLFPDPHQQVFAKLEFFNPSSSLKDRSALEMVRRAELSGKISKETVILEATSGNTGISLAFIAAVKKYRLILVMPEGMSTERKKLLSLLGAELELTPAKAGMQGAIHRVEELALEIPNSFVIRQFENPSNIEAHLHSTAKEILLDTSGQLDYLFIPVGTGGTLMGCAESLKQEIPKLKIIAIEPSESAVLSGKLPGPHLIQGIGAPFIPSLLNTKYIDEIVTVDSEDALYYTRQICRQEGILGGISSGAGVAAAKKFLKNKSHSSHSVLFFCDSAERYLSVEGLFEQYDSKR